MAPSAHATREVEMTAVWSASASSFGQTAVSLAHDFQEISSEPLHPPTHTEGSSQEAGETHSVNVSCDTQCGYEVSVVSRKTRS